MTQVIEFSPGLHISHAAQQLVAAAQADGNATGTFNGIELTATADSNPADIVAEFDRESEARAEKWRNSAAGIAYAKAEDERRASLQAKHNVLMKRLSSLDWSNDAAVLDWLCQMQKPSDYVGVITRCATIISAFEAHGFKAGENTGAAYRDGDRKNMFRYLVGQALDGLDKVGAIHPILLDFSTEWRSRFGVPEPSA